MAFVLVRLGISILLDSPNIDGTPVVGSKRGFVCESWGPLHIFAAAFFRHTTSICPLRLDYSLEGACKYIHVHPNRPIPNVILVQCDTFLVSCVIAARYLP